tara:strand:- start:309 stop:923 length:615 start_codon:yes stop_codon:yes gene_type:complete
MQLSSFGGVAGLALLLVSVLSIGIILERTLFWFFTLRKRKKLCSMFADSFTSNQPFLNSINSTERQHIVSLIAQIIESSSITNLEQLQDSLDQAFAQVEYQLQKYDGVLATIISVSPLLGLLGTVFGLIRSMNGLTLGSLSESNLSVMSGISEALISTAIGLSIAVVTLVASNIFRGLKTNELRNIRSLLVMIEHRFIDRVNVS